MAARSPRWHPNGKYFVDDGGHIKYLVDPGINGTLKTRDDGSVVEKFVALKAQLMSSSSMAS